MRSVPFRCRLLEFCFWEWPYKGLTSHGPQKHKALFQKEAWNFYDLAARKHINLSLWRSAGPGPHHSIKELCDPIDLKYLKQGWSSKQFLFYTVTQPLCVPALKHLLSVPLWCLTLESVTREQSSFIWNKLDSLLFLSLLQLLAFLCWIQCFTPLQGSGDKTKRIFFYVFLPEGDPNTPRFYRSLIQCISSVTRTYQQKLECFLSTENQ